MHIKTLAVSAVVVAMACTQVAAQEANSGSSSNAQAASIGNSNNQNGNSRSNSRSNANSGSYGNTVVFGGSKRSASSAIAPGLFASGLSCSGSAAAGGAGGGWGFSLGITKEDKDCNTRENAKTVLGLTGDRDATKEVLCDVAQMRNAFRRVGRPCIADYQAASAQSYNAPRPRAQRVTFRTMAECREYQKTNNVVCRTQ